MTNTEFTSRFRAARRAVIARDFPELNEAQLEAALKTQGAVRLVAGAGSGKTATLIARTANILKYGRGSDAEDVPADVTGDDLLAMERYLAGDASCAALAQAFSLHQVPRPWEILVVTFTNKAANELKERLDSRIGASGRYVHAMTFHSMGNRLLRQYGTVTGVDPDFQICDDEDARTIIGNVQDAIAKDNQIQVVQFKVKDLVDRVSAIKHSIRDTDIAAHNDPRTPEPGIPDPEDIEETYVYAVYQGYQRVLSENNMLDFDDLLLRTYDMLGHAAARKACQDMYRYIMVDEYQDTDPIQDAIIRILAFGSGNLCVVGDDDQSIYAFRGAEVDIFRRFGMFHPDAVTIKLEKNYRSREDIIVAANEVIEYNPDRIGKTMEVVREGGDPVMFHTADTILHEAEFVARVIRENVARGMKFSDHAVLVRLKKQYSTLSGILAQNLIPYDVADGHTFFKSKAVKDVTAYMRVALNPNDTFHMARIVLHFLPGIRDVKWNNILLKADAEKIGAIDVMADEDHLRFINFNKGNVAACKRFVASVMDMNEAAHDLPAGEAVHRIVELSGYMDYLESQHDEALDKAIMREQDKEVQAIETHIANVRTLVAMAQAYSESCEEGTDTLRCFLDAMSLDDGTETEDKDMVRIMTVHKAKGLEFPCVFVISLNEQAFPPAFNDTDIREERRMFYVAMTRAMDSLYLTRSQVYEDWKGFQRPSAPSRFLDELPTDRVKLVV